MQAKSSCGFLVKVVNIHVHVHCKNRQNADNIVSKDSTLVYTSELPQPHDNYCINSQGSDNNETICETDQEDLRQIPVHCDIAKTQCN